MKLKIRHLIDHNEFGHHVPAGTEEIVRPYSYPRTGYDPETGITTCVGESYWFKPGIQLVVQCAGQGMFLNYQIGVDCEILETIK